MRKPSLSPFQALYTFSYDVYRSFVNQLTQAYQPAANTLSTNVISIIDNVVSDDVANNQTGSLLLSPLHSRLIRLSRINP